MSLDRWQDAVIYFVLIDRFYNGDRKRDDLGFGEYDPLDDDCFHGGDLAGIRRKLPFIKEMGYTALWITPPVHGQWINPYITARGYHGYWAYDFTAVDPHFGTLADYKALVEEAHALGLHVIQDIVVNHTGNYFTIDPNGFDARKPELNWKACPEAFPPDTEPKAPNDPVFRMNNPNISTHKAAAVYNFTPTISDFKNRKQTLTWTLGDLDDINLDSPLAAARMKEIYRFWIEQVGIDGFRVDTVFYTPERFYEGFLHDEDGMKACAARRGIDDFFVFGEVWSYDYRAINKYIAGRRPRLDSAIDFPLNEALTQVFYQKAPTALLARALRAKRANANLWVNFLDNHDVERMFSRAGWPAVQQSLVAMFTLPGIPCITYGTEAGFTRIRADMFDDSLYDQSSREAIFLKQLISMRKADPVFARGTVRVERSSPTCGLASYVVEWDGRRRVVLFNTAPNTVFCDLPRAGYDVLLSSEGRTSVSGLLVLSAESFLVLAESPAPAAPRRRNVPKISMRAPSDAVRATVRLPLSSRHPQAVERAWLLIDDDYEGRLAISDPDYKFMELDTGPLGNGHHEVRVISELKNGDISASPRTRLLVRNPYSLLAETIALEKDKGGVREKIHPPADPTYCGQLSMESAAVYSSGRDLRLDLRMANVTSEWNPPNGFDHVYFNVFVQLPGREGKPFFPKLNYARQDFAFDVGFLVYGWGTRSFGAADSTPDSYGAPLVGDVETSVDLPRRTISFTLSSRYFLGLKSFSGAKVFVSTWDGYLGELRPVSAQRENWNFYILEGTGTSGIPKIFDHVELVL